MKSAAVEALANSLAKPLVWPFEKTNENNTKIRKPSGKDQGPGNAWMNGRITDVAPTAAHQFYLYA